MFHGRSLGGRPVRTPGIGNSPIPRTIAVETDPLRRPVSGAYGAFVYAQVGSVVLPIGESLFAGSVLGACIEAGAAKPDSEDDVEGTSPRRRSRVVRRSRRTSRTEARRGGADDVSIGLVLDAAVLVGPRPFSSWFGPSGRLQWTTVSVDVVVDRDGIVPTVHTLSGIRYVIPITNVARRRVQRERREEPGQVSPVVSRAVSSRTPDLVRGQAALLDNERPLHRGVAGWQLPRSPTSCPL